MKSFKSASVVLGFLWVLVLAGNALAANPVVSLKPGDSLQREFVLFSKFDFLKLSPAQVFVIIGSGDNASKLGDLSINIKSSIVAEEFGTDIDFTLSGVALPLSATPVPISISQVYTVPVYSATLTGVTKTVTFNSVYGVALLAIYISKFDGETYGEPVKFSITFSMAAAKAVAK